MTGFYRDTFRIHRGASASRTYRGGGGAEHEEAGTLLLVSFVGLFCRSYRTR